MPSSNQIYELDRLGYRFLVIQHKISIHAGLSLSHERAVQ